MRQIKPVVFTCAVVCLLASAAGADGTCYRCFGDYFYTPDAYCETQSTPALEDGTCPDGYSPDPPDCRANWDCRVGNAYCITNSCCGDFENTGIVGPGCTCYGCSGFATGFDRDSAYSSARSDSHAGCYWPHFPYTTLCGYYRNSAALACWIYRCGP